MTTAGDAGNRPFGVPLDTIWSKLTERGCHCARVGNELIVENGEFKSTLEVSMALDRGEQEPPISAVIRMTTEIHAPVIRLMRGNSAEWASSANIMATMGALMADGPRSVVGSRLVVFEREDVWDQLYVPMIVSSIQWAADSICEAWTKLMTREPPVGGTSAWSDAEFNALESHLSRFCVCNNDGLSLSAEFGLEPGATSAAVGDTNTALLSMRATEPHPHLGGGLYVLLRMPHKILDRDDIATACERLNHREMGEYDVPPHFGAWRCGPGDLGVAYTSFLPNELHAVPGIALNVATWALHRARWADAQLRALGHTA